MPLRDHFRPPLDLKRSWDELHGAWPTIIVMHLNSRLPDRYVAAPSIHLGAFEVDVRSFEETSSEYAATKSDAGQAGMATIVWAPPRPTFEATTDLPEQDEYEVRIYDTEHNRELVAVIEIVSPSNKDRPETRRAFVAKCSALLQQGVSVSIVDLVTSRQFNLYGELLDLIGQSDPSLSPVPPLYAAACRWAREGGEWRFRAWAHKLAIGQPLPTLPLWLADDLAVPLELEASYEETCRVLRIP